ncbi:MAG: SUMF1/EgtB/PvdO family nonheme iron enzyme [Flavobacteriaceae bacterium]|nr:SUMF1/EgtB/PvdO family nonheme iron enzyme [Flavobacteriaceae bacterium]
MNNVSEDRVELELADLLNVTKYYITPYIKKGDEVYYDIQKSFFTTTMISVESMGLSDISDSSAVCKIKVSNIETTRVISAGVVYGLDQNNLDIDSSNIVDSTNIYEGEFDLNLINLDMGTVYYIKSFVKYENDIVYGEQMTLTTLNPYKIDMIDVEGGEFEMFIENDMTRTVKLSSFKIGKFEITQKQWELLMVSKVSDTYKGENFPITRISWNDILGYIGSAEKVFI